MDDPSVSTNYPRPTMCQELTQVLKIHCWLKITALQHMGCGFKQAQVRDPKPLGEVPQPLRCSSATKSSNTYVAKPL